MSATSLSLLISITALVLAAPITIAGNLLTPMLITKWRTRSLKRDAQQLAMAQAELEWMELHTQLPQLIIIDVGKSIAIILLTMGISLLIGTMIVGPYIVLGDISTASRFSHSYYQTVTSVSSAVAGLLGGISIGQAFSLLARMKRIRGFPNYKEAQLAKISMLRRRLGLADESSKTYSSPQAKTSP